MYVESAPLTPDGVFDGSVNDEQFYSEWGQLTAEQTDEDVWQGSAEAPVPADTDAYIDTLTETAGVAERFRGDLVPDLSGQRPDSSDAVILSRQRNIDAALALVNASFSPAEDIHAQNMADKTADLADAAARQLPGYDKPDAFALGSTRAISDRTVTPLFRL